MQVKPLTPLFLVCAWFWALPVGVAAPEASLPEPPVVEVGGFADAYFAHDWDSPPFDTRPYTTQPRYVDELALNLAYVDAKVAREDVRGRVAAQYGSSVIANYANEPELFWRYVQEASAGYRIADGVWVDAGIMPSHIGLETWISRDNWTYTRSLIADYSPYYQSGARLSYDLSAQVSLQLHLLNGWQNISDARHPALGTQLSYSADSATSLVYNTFLGDEGGLRFFQDFLAKREVTDRFGVQASFDLGFQEREAQGDSVWWHGWALISRYKLAPDVRIAARVERYTDPHQVLVKSLSGQHLSPVGLSINLDVDLTHSLLWRTEYRALMDARGVFPQESGFSHNDTVAVSSLAYSWDMSHMPP